MCISLLSNPCFIISASNETIPFPTFADQLLIFTSTSLRPLIVKLINLSPAGSLTSFAWRSGLIVSWIASLSSFSPIWLSFSWSDKLVPHEAVVAIDPTVATIDNVPNPNKISFSFYFFPFFNFTNNHYIKII
ncbi:MAG: hypothetical protein NC236_02390 [Mycoplasma sp.]|nr:hypothetical protein [Mycoplasma sp.]